MIIGSEKAWCFRSCAYGKRGKVGCRGGVKTLKDKKAGVVIVCGKGNNGRRIGRLPPSDVPGIKPKIFLAAKISQVRGEARVNLDILLKMKRE